MNRSTAGRYAFSCAVVALAVTLTGAAAWASGLGAGVSSSGSKFASGTLQLVGSVGANTCYSTGSGAGGSVVSNSPACTAGSPVPTGTLSTTASSATTTLKSVGNTNATGARAAASCGVAELADSASATDWSGTGPNTALVYGGVTYGAAGPLGTTAATFDGSTGWAGTTTAYTNPQGLTVTGWIKTSSPQGVILGFDQTQNVVANPGSNSDRLLWIDPTGHLVWGINGGKTEVVSPAAVDTGSWVFVAASVGATGMALYVNGSLVKSNAAVTTAQTTTGYWDIGYSVLTTWTDIPASDYFKGSVAQVAIVASQLNAAEVSALYGDGTLATYSAAVTALSPANYWQMNDTGAVPYEGTIPGGAATTVLQDATGNGNTGTAVGGITYGVSGPISMGADGIGLNGTTGYAETTTSVVAPQTFSLSAWFETSVDTGSIFGFSSAQNTTGGYFDRMLWLDPTGHLVFGIFPDAIYELESSGTGYDNGAWHFVTVTVTPTSATTATVLMYVDGALAAGTANDETITGSDPGYAYSGWWHLGWSSASSGAWPDGSTTPYWEGSLSEMAVFPLVLTAARISTLYNAGNTAAFALDTGTDSPTSYWPLQDSASNICGTTEITVQTTVGSTNTCIFPAAAGACPVPSATYLVPGFGERSIPAPTTTTPVTVLVTTKLTAAPAAALAGLHELIDLSFGTSLSPGNWSAQIAYPSAPSQL